MVRQQRRSDAARAVARWWLLDCGALARLEETLERAYRFDLHRADRLNQCLRTIARRHGLSWTAVYLSASPPAIQLRHIFLRARETARLLRIVRRLLVEKSMGDSGEAVDK